MKLYRVTFTHKDGSTEVHEHQNETDLIKLGACDWSTIKSVSIEAEEDEQIAVTFPRSRWQIIATALSIDCDYYEEADEIRRQIAR